MCGIAGFLARRFPAGQDMVEVIRCMATRLKHRGPDDEGVWVDSAAGVALAHRRLSILDLSPSGHQPMVSPCGRYVIIFNGEIYNHLELRRELEDRHWYGDHPGNPAEREWHGHSDTESLLAAISVWGLEQALRKSVGMFAIALWDRNKRTLFLARDRMGEKPLYYGLHDNILLFASELKALRACPGFMGEVDRQALMLLLRHNVIPAPYSIYQGIFKLLPGTILKLSQADIMAGSLPSPEPYWSLREVAEAGQQDPFSGSEAEAIDELERLLLNSTAGQMKSDVPLGAFLSGGIDSSTIAAMMQAQSSRPVKTFTIGFHESDYNEASYAKEVANYLGTDHTELYVSHEQALAVIPRLPELYDEPFADSSQIPTFLVSELAKQHVTVGLSGDGGDELFGGYNRYIWGAAVWRRLHWLPKSLRATLAGVILFVQPSTWNKILGHLDTFLPGGWRYANPGDKLHKLADVLAVHSPEEIYQHLISHWKQPPVIVKKGSAPVTVLADKAWSANLQDLEHCMMYMDSISYLPDDILVKVDRAAMGVSMETRIPFIDHRLVEFAWRLPLSMKIHDGKGKWLVRKVLQKYIPDKLVERPKTGFGVPLDIWLRGPLKSWSESLIDTRRLINEGFFNAEPIQKMWLEHLSGRRNWSYHLWDILMFQQWCFGENHSL